MFSFVFSYLLASSFKSLNESFVCQVDQRDEQQDEHEHLGQELVDLHSDEGAQHQQRQLAGHHSVVDRGGVLQRVLVVAVLDEARQAAEEDDHVGHGHRLLRREHEEGDPDGHDDAAASDSGCVAQGNGDAEDEGTHELEPLDGKHVLVFAEASGGVADFVGSVAGFESFTSPGGIRGSCAYQCQQT